MGKLFSESIFQKSKYISDLTNCFVIDQKELCKNLILKSERMQLLEYERGNIKCQTSLLGAQTELINNIHFVSNKKYLQSVIIQNIFKNC